MQNAVPLIRTKLRPPLVRPGLVPRPRLQKQISQGLRGPLTLITAPAGFGKTTLVAACLADHQMPVAWLSLDETDNQPGRFLTYLIAALQRMDSRIGNEAVQLMAGMPPASPESVLTSLINDLDAIDGEMMLVLDDYQFIRNPEVHTQMAFLLDHCPYTCHLLIATRSDPPLPMARLRARGQTIELRAADLSFTRAEAAQFLNDVMGLHLDENSINVLEERTEGWAAGLQMAALSMRGHEDVRGFIEGFSGTNRYILDFLLEEILANQPPDIQCFLLFTSILERLSAPLCDVLLAKVKQSELCGNIEPDYQSAPTLEYLERENLFLLSLDDERTWFRYHHLFADLLKARLQQSYPNLAPSLHQQASEWLEQNELILDALQHLIAAGDINQAADLIERYGPVKWLESDLSIVQMADHLPHDTLRNHPRIGCYQAWLLINQGHIEQVLPLLHGLVRQLSEFDTPPEHKWILTFAQLALAFLLPPPTTADQDLLPDEKSLDEIPASDPVLRDAAAILYGMALGRRGQLDRAADFSIMHMKDPSTGKSFQGAQAIPALVPFLTTVYWFQGKLHSAASLCREYLDPVKEKGIRVTTAGNMDIIMGVVLYDWNCLEEAEKHVRDGLKANEPWNNIMTDAFGMLALTQILKAKGEFGEAMQIVDKFEARLQDLTRPREFTEDFHTLRVRLQLASGDLQAAFDWADLIPFSQDYQSHPEYYRVTLACVRLAQGKNVEVVELLAGKSIQDLDGNQINRQLESNLILAAAIAGQNRIAEALEILESCLALAESEGYIRIFLDIGEPARHLLSIYLRSGAEDHRAFAQKILETFAPSGERGEPAGQTSGLIEPLTERELEVLHLMALGKTNKEIARQLVVAPGTIKAHAASIYRKLDAGNRTEAVARARQLDLLS
jgi:LuxR family maltose regulon positive regulatory protein